MVLHSRSTSTMYTRKAATNSRVCEGRGQLFAAWVDFRKDYDCIPRQLLWLAARGLGGSWLRDMQALYTDVPMSVCAAVGPSPCVQTRTGLNFLQRLASYSSSLALS